MIFLALAVLLVLPLAAVPEHWASVLIFYMTFTLPLLLLPLRRRPRLLAAVWATIGARQAFAIVNACVITFFRAPDAMMFHKSASAIAHAGGARFEPGAEFYRGILGLAYSAAGPSLLLGHETSVLAYTLSCVAFVKLQDLMKVERHQAASVLIFGLLPAGLLYGSTTMRESWQVLFFISAVYFLIRFRLKAEPASLIMGVVAALAMGFLHNGLLAYALFLVPFALFSRVGARSSLSLGRLLGIVLTGTALAGLAAALVFNKLPRSASLEALTQGDALEYAAQYRENSEQGARAEYGIALETSSPLAFAKSVSLLFTYYMLAPFPWQIASGLDVFGAADSWFRALLLFFSVKAWRAAPSGTDANMRRVLLLLYLSMSLLWAMGTINYGTGIRHHIVTIWIPVLLGFPPLMDALKGRSTAQASRKAHEA